MSTEMLDVLSVLDDQDNPVLGNCTLVLGEVALEFKNGRSTVPVSKAPEVARCAKVKIPGYTGPVAPPVPSVTAELPSGEAEPDKSLHGEVVVSAAVEYLREQGLEVPVFDPAAAPQGTVVEGDGVEKTGIDVPVGQEGTLEVTEQPTVEVAKIHALPDGFEPLTAAGEPRCFARTSSGTQCSNASAPDSVMCKLSAHQEQAG